MARYVALLRAVNVGGTGKLPMAELRAMCGDIGFRDVKTYIASGNVVFAADAGEAEVKSALEQRLEIYAGKPVGVMIRTAEEMGKVLARNPFPVAPANRVVAIFLDSPPPPDTANNVKNLKNEEIALGRREIYVHYPDGQADTRLKIAAADGGTARNMNTVAKLAALAAAPG